MQHLSKIYLKFITKDNNKPSICNKIIAAFIYDLVNNTKYYYNFSHPDVMSDTTFEQFKFDLENKNIDVYVNNKKIYKYWLNCNLIDVNIFNFVSKNELMEEIDSISKNFIQISHNNINDFNLILPYVNHQEIFDNEIDRLNSIDINEKDSYCFKFFNNIITDTLYEVEKNGIKIDVDIFKKYFKAKNYNGYVYTNYNIYNPTGRPSNAYDNINYAALKKDDGSRASFISRYDNGSLLLIDFTGFHPYIVANIIDYKVPDEETIYEHLAKQYYNTQEITSDLIGKSKKLTMVNLYGQINDQYINIPFFKKTDELKERYWKKFVENGYVTTPIYKRKITNKHVIDANKNKLFAYIIQATETEYGMDRLKACLKFTAGKQILPILYNYDAILFDVGNVDQTEINDLIEIIKNKKFKVKVYKGNNYNDMKLV